MKASVAVIAACITSASAFAPQSSAPVGSALCAKGDKGDGKKSLFQTIFEMDLFAPVQDQNDYGARNKKKLGYGKLGDKSYVPAGLSKAEYEAIRNRDSKKKDANYQKNVAKAGKFIDYTDFYIKRGTDTGQDWYKRKDGGHRMAKTKFDYSGTKGDEPVFGGVQFKGGKKKK